MIHQAKPNRPLSCGAKGILLSVAIDASEGAVVIGDVRLTHFLSEKKA
jgi:hypothetical protein